VNIWQIEKKQHIRDRVARHRKEKRKHSNVVKEDMLNEEDVIMIKQQQLRDRVARHREVTTNNVCKGNVLNEEDEIKIKQQQLRDRVARH
jgi:hypothetical protein